MDNIEIALCDTGRNNMNGSDVIVCNLVEVGKNDVITKKYEEASTHYYKYEMAMAELQRLFEAQIGKALILTHCTQGPQNLNKLAERYGVELGEPDPGLAA